MNPIRKEISNYTIPMWLTVSPRIPCPTEMPLSWVACRALSSGILPSIQTEVKYQQNRTETAFSSTSLEAESPIIRAILQHGSQCFCFQIPRNAIVPSQPGSPSYPNCIATPHHEPARIYSSEFLKWLQVGGCSTKLYPAVLHSPIIHNPGRKADGSQLDGIVLAALSESLKTNRNKWFSKVFTAAHKQGKSERSKCAGEKPAKAVHRTTRTKPASKPR